MGLIDGQVQIGNTVLGPQTWYPIDTIDVGDASRTTNDVARPHRDGMRMGRDLLQGRTISFSMAAFDNGTAAPISQAGYEYVGQLAAEWNADTIRQLPGVYLPLSYCRAGETRRVYGRPRRWSISVPDTGGQWVPITADFQTVDHYFYSEDEFYTGVGINPGTVSGLIAPLVDPLIAVDSSGDPSPGEIFVGGDSASYPRFIITGPILNPSIYVPGLFTISFTVALGRDQKLYLDPTPWGGHVRLLDGDTFGANAAGLLTWDSPRMADMRIPPGRWSMVLRGTDFTGLSYVMAAWRNCYAAF